MNMLKSISYVSVGNIPSRKANAIQACQMAAALTSCAETVELVTQASIFESLRKSDIRHRYGLPKALRITRLRTSIRSRRASDGLFDGQPDRRFIKPAVRHCRWRRPSLVYTRSWEVAAATTDLRIPSILESHDPPTSPLKPRHRRIQTYSQTAAFRGLVTISPILADAYAALGVPREKILVIPSAVDTRPFDMANNQTSRPNERELRVGYCGNLYEGRGIDTMLQCAALLPEVQFELVGGYPRDVSRWKQQFPDLKNVQFTDYIPHSMVPRTLATFDILCMPYSRSCETVDWMSPLKLFEYMAAAKPIVATDLPVYANYLRQGENALICPPDSPTALANAIDRLCRSHKLREEMGAEARENVEEFSWISRARRIILAASVLHDVS